MSLAAPSPIVLASASTARHRLLEAAGVAVSSDPAAIDEAHVKNEFRREGRCAGRCAAALAEAKALHVAARHPGALVIGADQLLDCDGTWLDKPRDPDQARQHLLLLRDRTHVLHAAVAVAHDGRVVWSMVEAVQLHMRPFSVRFLDDYIAAMGERVCAMVGGYELEGLGAQLFDRVGGDYFAVLGLPLLPLLDFLRGAGALAS